MRSTGRSLLGVALCLSLTLWNAVAEATPTPKAEIRDGLPGYWSSAIKQAFGTAYESYDDKTAPSSKVWFTVAQGILTEVYWPTIDTAQVRDSQFLVTDGRSFFFDERTQGEKQVEWLETGVPAFRITTRDAQDRFEIERTLFADPDRDVVLQRVRIKNKIYGLRYYVLHNPAAANTPFGDEGEASPDGLLAWQGNAAHALVPSVPFQRLSAGFEGQPTDGYQDLLKDFTIDTTITKVAKGNIVLTGQLAVPEKPGDFEITLALGFSTDPKSAQKLAWASLNDNFDSLLKRYASQWRSYQKSVRDLSGVSGQGGKLFRASVAVMKSSEDKTHRGAFVASPSVPWGLHQADWTDRTSTRKKSMSGYHVIWPRDLYQVAGGFMAIDDMASAKASLDFLRSVQYGPEDGVWNYGNRKRLRDGSFPQNCWVDGENTWGGLQLDEVGMPVVLAYRLWKAGAIQADAYWDMVHRAADFVHDFGPWSPQERWEEIFGLSPSTIAAEIAALKAAAKFAEAMGDWARAEKYQRTALDWSHHLESWLFTTTGAHGNGRYYERIEGAASYDQKIDPNDETKFHVANGSGLWREKDLIDAGFLELVRFGVRRALSADIRDSLPEVDDTIRVPFRFGGHGYRRYLNDRYNYDEETYKQTLGMPWPLLTGERGHYELAAAVERGLSPLELDAVINPYIYAMERFATPTHMIPEQVWDYGSKAGLPTGAATPLGWAHAEYLKLLRSRMDRKVFDLHHMDN